MNFSNITLTSYEKNFDAYVSGTPSEVDGPMKQWFEKVDSFLPREATIFEIGSGTGRDAKFFSALGHNVVCSDAANSFVSHLQDEGFNASLFNALTDELPVKQVDAVFANAVLLHFSMDDALSVMRKAYAGLKPGGVFVFSVKLGEGSELSLEKLNAPRFFQYWSFAQAVSEPIRAGFHTVDCDSSGQWAYVIAVK